MRERIRRKTRLGDARLKSSGKHEKQFVVRSMSWSPGMKETYGGTQTMSAQELSSYLMHWLKWAESQTTPESLFLELTIHSLIQTNKILELKSRLLRGLDDR